MNTDIAATIGANLEALFDEYSQKDPGAKLDLEFDVPGNPGHKITLELVDHHIIESQCRENGGPNSNKCLVFRDAEGNLYIHFRGTGDGYWEANSSAYGPKPSYVQTESLNYFDQVMEEYYIGQGMGNVYVSGHSQGGNTAQYVTINSKYGDYIDICSSLDGPGFSHEVVEAARNQYGEAYFNRQCNKIYAYNGVNDYVSALGQEHIIPEGHTKYIGNQIPDNGNAFVYYHDVRGMLDNQSLLLPPEGTTYESSAFRNLIVSINESLKNRSPEEQAKIAILAMKFGECLLGNDATDENVQPNFSEDERQRFKEILFPFLIDYLEEHPDMVSDALDSLDMSPEIRSLIKDFLKEFNSLPDEKRLLLLNALGDCIVINNKGMFDFSWDILSLIDGVLLILPSVKDLIRENPKELLAILQDTGIVDMIAEWVKDHPLETFAVAVLGVLFFNKILAVLKAVDLLIDGLEVLASIIDFVIAAYDKSTDLAEDIRAFIVNTLKAIQKTIRNVKESFRRNSPGGNYVASNPYFKADIEALRNYANRLGQVNRRLSNLDGDLNDLYVQVQFDDLLKILQANSLTTYSARLLSAQRYLNSAASTLEDADNKALRYMGG